MSEFNDMSCAELADAAAELALGVLTGRERAKALAHLDHCEACREHVRQLTMTGEELLGLLPLREPPAGFETRVMERLGLSVPERRQAGRIGPISRFRRLSASPLAVTLAMLSVSPVAWAPAIGWGGGRGGCWPPRPCCWPSSPRALVAGVCTPLPPRRRPAGSRWTPPAFVSASHHTVGKLFYYDGNPQWVYMSVNLSTGNSTVLCQLESTDGQVTTVGSFRLNDGYGVWATSAEVSHGDLAGARLVAVDGTVLATAALPGTSALSTKRQANQQYHLPPNCAVSTVA